MIKTVLFLVVCLSLALQGCSAGDGFVANKRDADFYAQFVNPTNEWPQAESRMDELKLLQIDEVYKMRFLLFENGQVYYQINNLGNGNGHWQYVDGALTVIATRPIFDMELTFSAAETEGQKMVVRFIDRHGFNSAPVLFRNPIMSKSRGLKTENLKQFVPSEKNI